MTPSNPSQAEGLKYDDGKTPWDLVPWDAMEEVVDVLAYGAAKYEADNWRYVKHARRRYFAAAMRHTLAWFRGERNDPESGKHHLAHAACCILFLLAFDVEKGDVNERET